jgi:hypothetical protein
MFHIGKKMKNKNQIPCKTIIEWNDCGYGRLDIYEENPNGRI